MFFQILKKFFLIIIGLIIFSSAPIITSLIQLYTSDLKLIILVALLIHCIGVFGYILLLSGIDYEDNNYKIWKNYWGINLIPCFVLYLTFILMMLGVRL